MNKSKTNKAQQQYFRSKVLTASPAELVLMLYDGCIKFCNQAISAINLHNIQQANINIQKAERIITELKVKLNFKYEVAKDFDNIYTYLLIRLHDANIHKDADILRECITHLRTTRETWVQVIDTTKKKEVV